MLLGERVLSHLKSTTPILVGNTALSFEEICQRPSVSHSSYAIGLKAMLGSSSYIKRLINPVFNSQNSHSRSDDLRMSGETRVMSHLSGTTSGYEKRERREHAVMDVTIEDERVKEMLINGLVDMARPRAMSILAGGIGLRRILEVLWSASRGASGLMGGKMNDLLNCWTRKRGPGMNIVMFLKALPCAKEMSQLLDTTTVVPVVLIVGVGRIADKKVKDLILIAKGMSATCSLISSSHNLDQVWQSAKDRARRGLVLYLLCRL